VKKYIVRRGKRLQSQRRVKNGNKSRGPRPKEAGRRLLARKKGRREAGADAIWLSHSKRKKREKPERESRASDNADAGYRRDSEEK